MSNQREKKPDAEKSREFLLNIVKNYYLTTDEEKAQHRNKGALKYLKDMQVSNLVLSPNPKKRIRKESFRKYFNDFVLPSDYDTLISYTDPDLNLKEFLAFQRPSWKQDGFSSMTEHSFGGHCTDPGNRDTYPMESGGILLPFLLLRHLQQVVEQNLDDYLRQESYYPRSVEDSPNESKANDLKEIKYIHLAYSLQYYEIFMEEFRKSIMDSAQLSQNKESFLTMQKIEEQFKKCTDEEEKLLLGRKLLTVTQEYMATLSRMHMTILYAQLYMQHFINLLALLRIVVIVEYVNINTRDIPLNIKGTDTTKRRKNVEELATNKLKSFNLFFFNFNTNRNVKSILKNLTRSAEDAHVIPDLGNTEEMNEFRRNLETYIGQIRRKCTEERNAAEEELLMESQLALAKPFLCQLAELKDSQELFPS